MKINKSITGFFFQSLVQLFLICMCLGTSVSFAKSPDVSDHIERPNIIFIFADDWGWGDLSCHGHESFETPNIDRLAKEGTEFYEFTVSNPVCSPSRTAVMTGHFPARYSINRHFWNLKKNEEFGMPDWLDPEPVMLPRLFKEAGYKTGHFGKWHLCGRGYSGPPEPTAYGYDESAIYGGPGPRADASNSSTFHKTLKFIKEHQDSPFFINMWIHETHTPHFPKKRFLKEYSDLDERERVYAAVVAEADHGIGLVLDALDGLGLSENTMVIFSSDNGPEQGSLNPSHKEMQSGPGLGLYYSVGSAGGLKGRKRSLYEGGVRVPFIVRWPGKTPAGAVNETTVISAVDLLPTFCAAAGISLPSDYQPDGENLLDAFLGKEIIRNKPIFWQWTGPPAAGWSADPSHEINWARLGVRLGEWKLLTNYDGSRKELYKVPEDREEDKNLILSNPKIASELFSAVMDWKKELPDEPAEHCISDKR